MSDVPLPERTPLPVLTKAAGGCYMGKYDLHQLTSVELQRLLDNAAAVSAAENAALRERMGRLEEVLRIVRQYPDFDGGGPMPDMIDDELEGKPSVMLEGMKNITTKLGSQTALAIQDERDALRADNTDLQNNVVMPLRERVRVLEHELSEILGWALKEKAPLRDQEIRSIRQCLSLDVTAKNDKTRRGHAGFGREQRGL
jgi:hypothetical protein